MKARYASIFYAVFALLVCNCALANNDKIRVVTEHFPPYQIVEEGKPLRGTSVNIIQKLLENIKVNSDIEAFPWARAYKIALTYPNVLIFSISRVPERENLFHWIGPLDSMCNYLWTLSENTSIKVNSLEDAKEYIVGTPRDDTTHHYLLKNGFNGEKNLQVVNTREQAVKMLFSKRVDLIMGAELMINQRVNKLGFDFSKLTKVFTLPSQKNNELSIAFSKSTPLPIVQKFQRAYQKLINSSKKEASPYGLNCT